MSIIRNGVQLATTGVTDYDALANRPQINGTLLTGNVTIDATNILSVSSLPTTGQDQSKLYLNSNKLNWWNGSAWVVLSDSQNVTSGTGITVTSAGVVNHTNSVTADTVGSATVIPQITFDSEGHITSVNPITVYPPTTVGTSGQYWKSDGAGAGAWQTPGTVADGNANLVTGGTVYQYLQDNGGGGGASVTLNGTATTSASFYAPTAAGTSKTILVSKGENTAPQYTPHASIDDNSSDTIDQQAFTTLTLGNGNAQSSGDDHSEGRIIINSAGTGAHRLVGASSDTTYVNTLPNSAGLLVSNGVTDGTAVGSTKDPVYISADGVTTACGNDLLQMFYDAVHPVNEIVIGFAAPTVPSGVTATWSDISSTYNNKALWIASGSAAGTSLDGSLPSIEHTHTRGTMEITGTTGGMTTWNGGTGAFSVGTGRGVISAGSSWGQADYNFTASNGWSGKTSTNSSVNSVYNASAGTNVVRPTSVVVHVYKRTA